MKEIIYKQMILEDNEEIGYICLEREGEEKELIFSFSLLTTGLNIPLTKENANPKFFETMGLLLLGTYDNYSNDINQQIIKFGKKAAVLIDEIVYDY